MEVRGRKRSAEGGQSHGSGPEEHQEKRPKTAESEKQGGAAITVEDSDEEVPVKEKKVAGPQILRISAGKAAAAAGIHRYSDAG